MTDTSKGTAMITQEYLEKLASQLTMGDAERLLRIVETNELANEAHIIERRELLNVGKLVMTVCTHCGGYPDDLDGTTCAECEGRGFHIHVPYNEVKNFDELSKYTLTD